MWQEGGIKAPRSILPDEQMPSPGHNPIVYKCFLLVPNYLLSTIRICNIEVSSIADTFLVSVKVLPILLKKVSAEVLPILFGQKIDPFYRYFFLYYICFNGLPQFAAVKSLVTLGGKIFAPLLTRQSSRHFEIVIFFNASKRQNCRSN